MSFLRHFRPSSAGEPALGGLGERSQPWPTLKMAEQEAFFAGQLRALSLAVSEDDVQRVVEAVAERVAEDRSQSDAGSVGVEDEPPFTASVALPSQPQFTLAYPEPGTGSELLLEIGGEPVTLEQWALGLRDALAAAREPGIDR